MSACRKCGASNARPCDVERNGVVEATGHLCDPCFAEAFERFTDEQKIFEELIAAGVSRERANAIMIERLEGKGATT